MTDAGARQIPLRHDDAAFAELRRILRSAGYGDVGVAARTNIDGIYEFRSVREGRPDPGAPRDALDVLIRLLLDGEPVARRTLDGLVPGFSAPAARLGLVRPHPAGEAHVVPTVRMSPVCGLFVASDLEHDPTLPRDAPYVLPTDTVFSAITDSTRMLVGLQPDERCDRFLDLCAGTAIAGLLAAGRAAEVVATDIAPRSVAFARFNAALNGLSNVRVVESDVYDALAGEMFDRIVAHPPYMPSGDVELIYRDGGDDGEQVTRRVLAGLPAHLRPGGRFDCIGILTDREDAPVEARVRALLGERSDEFDVLVLVTQANAPIDAYARLAREGRNTFAEAARRVRRFDALGARSIVGCSLVIVRHETPRPAVTVRRNRSPATDASSIAWVLGWMRASGDPALTELLLSSRPRLSPRARLDRAYSAGDDGWHAGDTRLRVDAPFAMVTPVSAHTAGVLATFDGTRTTREQLEKLREEGVVGPDMTPADFAALVRSLVLGGFLMLDPPPARD